MAELSLLVKATLILTLALATTRLAQRASAAVRALVLTCAFAAIAALPLAAIVIPARSVQLPVATGAAATFFTVDAIPSGDSSGPPVSGAPAQATRAWPMPPASTLARGAWLAGAILFAFPFMVALVRLRTLRRRALPWRDGDARLEQAVRQAGVRRRVRLLLHDDLAAPMTCGAFRPAIVLPVDAASWSEADLRQALLHEIEHVRRADWPLHVAARLICAAYWFHPLAWMAWRQLCLEAERACDDAVLRHAESTAYAEQLVSLARRIAKAPAPLLSMADRSHLSTRVRAVLDAAQPRGHVRLLYASIIGVAAALLTLAISPLQAVRAETSVAPDSSAPAFAVASVRRSISAGGRAQMSAPPGTGQLTITNTPLVDVVQAAYGLPLPSLIVDLPDWARGYRVDIVAKAASPVPVTELQRMLQPLLATDFMLVARQQRREMDALVLTVDRADGRPAPGLKPTSAECDTAVGTTNRLALGREGADAKGPCGFRPAGVGRIVATGLDMSGLALFIAPSQRRPVIDGTGLAGRFDIDLTYTPEPFAAAALAQRPGATVPAGVDPDGPSLVTALREQLGLRLESRRLPIEVVVIERLEPLAENGAGQAPVATTFEVASIRRNTSGEAIIRGVEIMPGGRAVARNIPLRFLIANVYGLPPQRVTGGAPWLDSDRFDIEAVASADISVEHARTLLKALLADRFSLAAHMEQPRRPVYELRRAFGDPRLGPGLRAAGAECTPIRPPSGAGLPPPPPPPPPAGTPSATPLLAPDAGPVRCPRMFFPGFLAARRISMRDFAVSLSNFARRPVIDATGLDGAYDLDLTFTPDVGPPGAAPAPPDQSAPSLFAALEEQLGLRLVPAEAPVDILVVDRVEPPTPN